MFLRTIVIILGLFLTLSLSSQDLSYARRNIETLTSSNMKGRGYVGKGDRKAASFIAREFDHLGIGKFNGTYFQAYHFGINTIRKVSLAVDGKKLIPGVDYVVSSSSPDISGTFRLYPGEDRPERSSGGFFAVTDIGVRDIEKDLSRWPGATGMVSRRPPEENMWWHVSNGRKTGPVPVFVVRSDLLDSTSREVRVKVRTKFVDDYKTQNVIGFVPGTTGADSIIVFTAHYDHLGCMGKQTCFPGANDNASGTAMVMDLARHFSHPENRPENTIVFIALSGEEAGLEGAMFMANHSPFELDKVKFLINLDMVGTGGSGITVVNGEVFSDAFNLLKQINEEQDLLPEVAVRGESCNSDHCPFYQKGVPSFFIYTRGDDFNEYHNLDDRAEDLPLTGYADLFRLLVTFTERL